MEQLERGRDGKSGELFKDDFQMGFSVGSHVIQSVLAICIANILLITDMVSVPYRCNGASTERNGAKPICK
jgi:hypothetical protein